VLGGKKCLFVKERGRKGKEGGKVREGGVVCSSGREDRLICFAVHFQRKIAHALKVKL
jgi:hypothetical protein